MKPFLELISQVATPGRYLPLEYFKTSKKPAAARVSVALAFPDLYEVGMSHLGVSILYHLLNQEEGIACERAYAPDLDLEHLLRRYHVPLASHESGTPLKDFDVLGFSLTYELCYTNVLNMLDLAGIPLFTAERKAGRWPLILGGGPAAANPEPLAPFFDAFLFGDGEEAAREICAAVGKWKEGGGGREDLLASLAEMEGIYVPEYFDAEYEESGRIRAIQPRAGGPQRIRRRVTPDLDQAFFPSRPLVPLIEPVHDRLMLEVARGCSRGCRFCQAGIIYRPVRERSAEKVLQLARESLAATGYEECSLLALSAGDYSGLNKVLLSLIQEHYASRVSVSLPSLRVQGLPDPLLRAIESVRKTGFTLAPEAGTDRLRRVINKTYSEAELMETARRVFDHGWRNLKLYFMVGLPTETDEDIAGILRLAQEVSRVRGSAGRPQVTLSLSGFVPKPHTPFQWEGQAPTARLREIQEQVRREFAGRNQRVKWQDPRMSELEGAFSRGDRRLAAVLVSAFRQGLRFDGWSEHFNYAGWRKAFEEAGVAPEFYLRPRERDEVFPWEHLDSGVSREWLWEERDRAYQEIPTPDCRETGCLRSCGVCDHSQIMPRFAATGEAEEAPPREAVAEKKAEPEFFFLYRVQYARRGMMRFLGQLEVTRLFARAVRRAGLPMRYSQGFHPLPRIMFGPPPPVGVASEAEFVDLELTRRWPAEEVRNRLQSVMPEGIVILTVSELPLRSSPISAVITGYDYEVQAPEGGGIRFDPRAAEEFLARDQVMIRQKREKGDREVDLRSRVRFLEASDSGVRLGLRVVEGPGVKPQEVMAHVFGLGEEEVRSLIITRTAARLKTARPVRFPGRGERARKVPGSSRGLR